MFQNRSFSPRSGYWIAGLIVAVLVVLSEGWCLDRDTALERVPFDEVGDYLVIDPYLFAHREDLLGSIHTTRAYLQTESARSRLHDFGDSGVTIEILDRSLARFAEVLRKSSSHKELIQAIRASFDLYRSVGSDGRGSVFFTGYFRPVYEASRVPTRSYRYPLFRRPLNFDQWSKPHPTRVALEGFDGVGSKGTLLHGSELVWLRSRFEAFMIHVQGSAVVEFPDGSKSSIGFAGATDYAFRGIPMAYLKEHKIAWAKLPQFFTKRPDELDRLLAKNNRFIFFMEQESSSPIGSLGLPVVEERSIAIDQKYLPPGAVSIIRTSLPRTDEAGKIQVVRSSRFVLGLDSGSAIRGPGRVDVFMGTGDQARERANHVHGGGQLYYLFAKEGALDSGGSRS